MDTTSQTRKEAPFFSVVIPLYNKEKNIERTINSVLSQTFSDYEIIVVDDGSTDNGPELVRSKFGSQVRLVEKANGGVSSARNLGVNRSQGRWIALLDADDIWCPDHLKSFFYAISKYPDGRLFGGAYNICSSGTLLPPPNRIVGEGYVQDYFRVAKTNTLFWTSAVVINKKVFEKIGGFDERISIGEDLDLWFRVNALYKTVFVNNVVAIYNTDAGNRAMRKKYDFSKTFFAYLDKYDNSSSSVQKFVCYLRVRYLPYMVYKYSLGKDEYHSLVKKIKRTSAGKSVFYRFIPYCVLAVLAQLVYYGKE